MIFWIVLGVSFVAAILLSIWLGGVTESFVSFLTFGFVTLFVTYLIGVYNTIEKVTDDHKVATSQLVSLGTASETEGRFYFLGGGYIDEQRTLNFIIEDEVSGGNYVKSVAADDSVIFESDDKPRLETWESSVSKGADGFWTPFTDSFVKTEVTYKFYIPEGSILNDYSVTN